MPLEQAPVPDRMAGSRVAVLVSGGIAAYKVADLVSQLVQAGCAVRVAMTEAATRFVGPETFRGVSGQEVLTDFWAPGGAPEPHVELGDWARVVLVAPATANVLAELATGLARDLVGATVLAARCPVVVAPAMNDAMWTKPAVQENLAVLRRRGITVVEPETGHLASGHVGAGRLAGAAAIFSALAAEAAAGRDLAGRKVVVTAGGTRERIDPVRFISNYSSGKMGFAVASAAAERGAEVVLVTTSGHAEHPGVRVRRVETAGEMLGSLRQELPGADLLAMAAAVADFRPADVAPEKIRRDDRTELTLQLTRNLDVLGELAKEPGLDGLFRLGFAAEGSDLLGRAEEKVERKGLDAILANDITRSDIAFGADHNAGVLLFRDGTRVDIDRVTKREMADRILDAIVPRLK